ncbi:MAG: hypothetical protein ACYTGX_03420 [Planctomycetota bacterium]|jgi:hypothetical protein
MRWATAAALGVCAALGSCAAAPQESRPRHLADAWLEAGAVLPAGASRTLYARLAGQAVAQVQNLRRAELEAVAALAVSDGHGASRSSLYVPLERLAQRRRALLADYARTRLAMREAVTEAEWARVVKAVRP